jgi:ATP-dependent DNA ligase
VASQRKKSSAIGGKAPYPGFIEPALAASIDKVPSGSRWIHEIKFDGYRVQVHIKDARSRSSPAVATSGPSASARSLPMSLRSTLGPPSSMARSLCRGQMASRISPFCRTN